MIHKKFMKINYRFHLDFIGHYQHLFVCVCVCVCVCVVNEILSHTGTTNIVGTNTEGTKKKEMISFPLL